MTTPKDEALAHARTRRADAARDQGDWQWRVMLAAGVGNGSGLIAIGSLLGASGFADPTVRSAFTPAIVIFILGIITYIAGPMSNWFAARSAAERFNQEEQALLKGLIRSAVGGAWVPNTSGVEEANRHRSRSKAYGEWAKWARLGSWATTFGAALLFIMGLGTLAVAVYSGHPPKPAVSRRP